MGFVGLGSREVPEDDFTMYYNSRGDLLRNAAYLLCGDWYLAEDLTQTTFTKLYRAWHRIERHDTMDNFARRVLLRAFLDERRRPWCREHAAERLVLQATLMRLPARHRAVLVLRYWSDLPVGQVADVLGCSVGTVKVHVEVSQSGQCCAFATVEHLTDASRSFRASLGCSASSHASFRTFDSLRHPGPAGIACPVRCALRGRSGQPRPGAGWCPR